MLSVSEYGHEEGREKVEQKTLTQLTVGGLLHMLSRSTMVARCGTCPNGIKNPLCHLHYQ